MHGKEVETDEIISQMKRTFGKETMTNKINTCETIDYMNQQNIGFGLFVYDVFTIVTIPPSCRLLSLSVTNNPPQLYYSIHAHINTSLLCTSWIFRLLTLGFINRQIINRLKSLWEYIRFIGHISYKIKLNAKDI